MATQPKRTRDDYIAIALGPVLTGTIGALAYAYGDAPPLQGALLGALTGAGIEYYMLRIATVKSQKNASAGVSGTFNLTMREGGHINRGSVLDFFRPNKRKPQNGISHQMPLPPLEIAEFMFWSAVDVDDTYFNIQLPDSFVRRFLRYADRKRNRGKGLSRNNWVSNGLCDPLWYDAMLNLLLYAQHKRRLQIILLTKNNYKRLAYNWYTTYAYLRLVEKEKQLV